MSEKKKSKLKAAVIIICLLLVLAGVGGILWMAWTMPVEEAQAYVERLKTFAVERVAPVAVAVLGAVAVILSLIAPAVTRVKTAADRFDGASEAIDAEQTESIKTRQCVESYRAEQAAALDAAVADMNAKLEKKLKEMEGKIDAACERLDAASGSIDENNRIARQSREMLRVGFGSSRELVEAGKARRIQMIADGQLEPGGDKNE